MDRYMIAECVYPLSL